MSNWYKRDGKLLLILSYVLNKYTDPPPQKKKKFENAFDEACIGWHYNPEDVNSFMVDGGHQ